MSTDIQLLTTALLNAGDLHKEIKPGELKAITGINAETWRVRRSVSAIWKSAFYPLLTDSGKQVNRDKGVVLATTRYRLLRAQDELNKQFFQQQKKAA